MLPNGSPSNCIGRPDAPLNLINVCSLDPFCLALWALLEKTGAVGNIRIGMQQIMYVRNDVPVLSGVHGRISGGGQSCVFLPVFYRFPIF